MPQNLLQLNQVKTVNLITGMGKEAQREKLATELNSLERILSQHTRNLCVIFDSGLNFIAHVGYVIMSFLKYRYGTVCI